MEVFDVDHKDFIMLKDNNIIIKPIDCVRGDANNLFFESFIIKGELNYEQFLLLAKVLGVVDAG